jgi:hypothetical protein
MQQLILGTGSAIWWVTEPHWFSYIIYFNPSLTFGGKVWGVIPCLSQGILKVEVSLYH